MVSSGKSGFDLHIAMTNKHTAHPLLPYTSRFVTVQGFKMHYIDEGTGPVVLLLHGNPTWCFLYRKLIDKLNKQYRVIAPDFIGMGLSERTDGTRFRATDRVDQIQELIKKLELDTFSVVMHDWGGSIGTAVATRMPERIERLIYLNTTLTETEALPALIKFAAAPVIGKFLTKYSKQFLRFTTNLGVSRKLSKEVRNGYYFPYKSADRRSAIWEFVDDIPFDNSHPSYGMMLQLAEGLPRLADHPVQIIWGLKDPCFHREMLNKVARHFPKALVYEIPEASHLVLEDEPETVTSLIKDFLGGRTPQIQVSDPSDIVADGVLGEPNALFAAFKSAAKQYPTKPAAVEPLFIGDSVRYGHTTYQEMLGLVNKYQRGLAELGLRSGDKVLMLVPAGVEFLALSYAVMGRGAIPVFVDPGIGRDNLFECIKDIRPDVFIGSPRAQLLRLKKRKLLPGLRFHLTASDWVYTGGPKLSFLKRFSSKAMEDAPSTGVAFIAFTSGATGLPKGVVFTNQMMRSQLDILGDQLGLKAGTKDLPLLPIFSLFHLANGICSVFPQIDSSRPLNLAPDRILKVIHDLQIDSSFGSPTLWNKIAEYCVRSGATLGSLKKIYMAGAPVPRSVLQRVREVMEEGESYTPYGATEALPVSMISSSQILEHQDVTSSTGELGTLVGRAVKGVELKIIEPVDAPIEDISQVRELPPLSMGEVIVKGSNISPEYFERPDATKLAKIGDGESFWHRMGDIGYLDDNQNLYFCGRKAHCIVTSSGTYYSIPTERIFNAHPQVKRSALVSLGEDSEPGIVVEPLPQFWPDTDQKRAQFLKELESLAASSKITSKITWFFFHPSFPVDSRHNAKIYRDQLSDWAQRQLQLEEAA